jgi:hypothetical protein
VARVMAHNRWLLKKLAADPVVVEPVSTGEFPVSREKNREFFDFPDFAQHGGAC